MIASDTPHLLSTDDMCNHMGMITSDIALRAMDKLRAASVSSKLSKVEIAKRTNVDRNTVTKRLCSNDLSISAFFATAEAVGINPIDALAEAYNQSPSAAENTIPALAERGTK